MITEYLSREKASLFTLILGILKSVVGLFCLMLAPAEIFRELFVNNESASVAMIMPVKNVYLKAIRHINKA